MKTLLWGEVNGYKMDVSPCYVAIKRLEETQEGWMSMVSGMVLDDVLDMLMTVS